MKKPLIVAFAVLLFSLFLVTPAQQHTYADEPVRLRIFGQTVVADVPPVIINGRVMVPIRYVVEALKLNVAWNEETRTVDITRPEAKTTRPEIFGSELFKYETDKAMNLLQSKYPDGYALVCSAFTSVQEQDIAEDKPIAWVFGYERVCFFNSRLGSIPTEERAIYLCHEAAHAAVRRANLASALTKEDDETVAWLAGYRAAQALGATHFTSDIRNRILKNLP